MDTVQCHFEFIYVFTGASILEDVVALADYLGVGFDS